MNLIVLYGPPAVGKLTVGKELAKLTGYKLFHNHLAIDLAHEIYEWGDPAFFTLVHAIRTTVIESAAKSDTNIILTFFYTGAESEKSFFKRVEKIVETSGGNISFVQLTAPVEILRQRVTDTSRQKFGKLTDEKALQQTLAINKAATFNHSRQVTLDASKMTPLEMAETITIQLN